MDRNYPFGYSLRAESPLFVPNSPSPEPSRSLNRPSSSQYIRRGVPDLKYEDNSSPSSFVSLGSSTSSTPRSAFLEMSKNHRRPDSFSSSVAESSRARKRRRTGGHPSSFESSFERGQTPQNGPTVIDLTGDSSPGTHTEGEIQAAYTLESMRRPQVASGAGGASATLLEGSRAAPIMIDDLDNSTDKASEELRRVAAKQREDAVKAQSKLEGAKKTTLNSMNCVICMDVPTSLTMAHCGHAFCNLCLLESLRHSEIRTRTQTGVRSAQCPVCRKPVSTTKKEHITPLLIKVKQPKNKQRASTRTNIETAWL
ncbi:hypothetical protein BT63DRAFT_454054 [Microthyrium microscopicum]|uniref:RING-type domain-containing protein n=1 Tax=Microthyrium microscopicum TaxID=703497 RepID=A0A6A6UEL6_9PEZI|nr:hypothetical protein BT63DRAFT_454054 [Microthyrium microscopicum]